MFERLYTTKMSADKKSLQKRFSKIRSHNGKISKVIIMVTTLFVAVTMICATVVMAAVNEFASKQNNIYQNKLKQIYLTRIKSERDEYIYFGKHSEKYNPVVENDREYFDELKKASEIEEETNVSIDVSDDELKKINPYFYYSQKIKRAGEKCQNTYSNIDLLLEENSELLTEAMNTDLELLDVPDDLFVDKEAIYLRGIVTEQLQNAIQKDNAVKGNKKPYSNAISY